MQTGSGHVTEVILEHGHHAARLSCPPGLVPMPGQYLLAGDGSGSLLPVPIFYGDSAPGGFLAAGPVPDSWNPGTLLSLRGPLGRGFTLPAAALRVALVSYNESSVRLHGLIRPALNQDAAVVLVGGSAPEHLPDEVEVQPFSALSEVWEWADYIALDVARGNLSELQQHINSLNRKLHSEEVQILIRTPIPCGGVAECGVCVVALRMGWRLACKDGPVFEWRDVAA